MANNPQDEKNKITAGLQCAECKQPIGVRPFIEVKQIRVLRGYSVTDGHTTDHRQIITRVHLEHLLNQGVRGEALGELRTGI